MIKILLICSSGASSGFMVQSMKKVAKSKGLELDIEARGDSQLKSFLNKVDVVLAGPHLRVREKELKDLCWSNGKPFAVIDSLTYGQMNGEKGIELAFKSIEEFKQSNQGGKNE